MINANGVRVEKIRAELLDKFSIKKCDIEVIDGAINCDSSLSIAKSGSVTFKHPEVTRLAEDNPPNTDIILTSSGGKKYYLGIDADGALCTYPVNNTSTTIEEIVNNIFVDEEGTLFGQTLSTETIECTLMDLNGYTWDVGVEIDGVIFTNKTGEDRKVYYRKEKVEINYLTDRLKVSYEIDGVSHSLGEYMMVKPKRNKNIISTPLMDLTVLIQKRRTLDPVLFVKGTPYVDVLSYFIIKAGYTKLSIEPTSLTLQSDRVFDDSKNFLEWFNLVASEINYTNLQVDDNGYFMSNKYKQPSLSNVKHVYKVDKNSIISGDFDVEQDFWNIYNVIKCVHSNPNTLLLVSIARNDDPSDDFSTYGIGEVPLTVVVNNVADKQELDGIATKTLFQQRQIAQDVTFNTLINPVHGIGDVLQIMSHEFEGVVLESKWSIPLKVGSLMTHTARKIVDIRSVTI